MTDPGRYDRPDPCEHCGEPRCGCDETWPDDERPDLLFGTAKERRDFEEQPWLDDDYDGLRVVRDLRTGGEVL